MKINLSPLMLEDIDDEYCNWFINSDGHLNFYTGSGRVFTRQSIIDDYLKGINEGKWFYYLITDENDVKIGNVKIGPIDKKNKTSDLVCFVGNRNYLGKGLSSKAIKIANEIAFSKYDIRRLQGGMIANNVASIRAYLGAGWFVEGTFRGYYLLDDIAVDRVCVACLNPVYFK